MSFEKTKTAFIFPGQGSQKIGMGRTVAEAFPEAKSVFEEVDEALGENLSKIIFSGEQEVLNLTENTQPAIMATSIATLRVMEKADPIEAYCVAVAGHSLGEYSALCASGALSLADTARLLKIRGKAMQEAVPVGIGAMSAILGLGFDTLKEITEETGCEIANDNCEGQIVISGTKESVERGMLAARKAGARKAIELPVSAPFHCKLMQPAAEKMAEALANVEIQSPKLPIIANVTATQVDSPEKIRELLVQQVTGMVRWRESVKYMHKVGIHNLTEIGFGKVLSGMTKRIEETMNSVCLQHPEDIEAYLK
ncbi:MAG: [acyl-carrier-protein] S-malonyltransferase [Alphaproteobacteria bacterium CG11_big_fil_rev_8_21_14_0_20_44_7]|nr:MAG: [acyl-carrier-protein] S-malonyltransferase [Alphaproteobacteria bacterium CG11_big_fil_rev_8_21_14_0_20_44_7]